MPVLYVNLSRYVNGSLVRTRPLTTLPSAPDNPHNNSNGTASISAPTMPATPPPRPRLGLASPPTLRAPIATIMSTATTATTTDAARVVHPKSPNP